MTTTMTGPMIEVTGLHKHFGDVHALAGVDLTAATGEVVGVLGPNGAGKTTMIDVLTTLLRPDGGKAKVAGFDVVAEAAAVRGVIGLTGQFAAVDENLTGRENLVLFGRLLKLGRRGSAGRAAELLDQFELTEAADRRVSGYSGGMRRRLDLAASLIIEPKALFLDEPTTGLDPRSRQALWAVIRDLRALGTTILLTTQYLDEADQLADRIVVIDRGHVIATGPAAELKDQIGGSRCEITVADAGDRDRAITALAGMDDLATTDASVTVAADGPATLLEVARRLDAAGVVVDDIGVRRPTLDDVFLTLTGHTADGDDHGPHLDSDLDPDPGSDASERPGRVTAQR